jgi:stage II sporulation protein M
MVSLVFGVSLVLGYLVVSMNAAVGNQLMTFLKNELFVDVADSTPFSLFLKIFLNNLEACILLFLGGASLGILTMLIISLNGMVIGGVVALVGDQRGLPFLVAAIAPHGLLEIPAFLLSGAMGLLLARALWAEWKGSGDLAETGALLGRIFVRIVIPLVVIAAFIEAFITPYIITLLL